MSYKKSAHKEDDESGKMLISEWEPWFNKKKGWWITAKSKQNNEHLEMERTNFQNALLFYHRLSCLLDAVLVRVSNAQNRLVVCSCVLTWIAYELIDV